MLANHRTHFQQDFIVKGRKAWRHETPCIKKYGYNVGIPFFSLSPLSNNLWCNKVEEEHGQNTQGNVQEEPPVNNRPPSLHYPITRGAISILDSQSKGPRSYFKRHLIFDDLRAT